MTRSGRSVSEPSVSEPSADEPSADEPVTPESATGFLNGLVRLRLAVVGLIGLHVLLVGLAAIRMSPTIDEPGHLAAGISHWRTGEFDLYRVNPPLTRLIASLPAVIDGADVPHRFLGEPPVFRQEFAAGAVLFQRDRHRAFDWMLYGRLCLLPLDVLGCLAVARWAWRLYGAEGSLSATALWCFLPLLTGNAALMTPDAGATAAGVIFAFAFWNWRNKPGWRATAWAGLGLGLCLATKSTWLVLLPLWPALWLVTRDWRRGSGAIREEFTQAVGILIVGLLLLNTVYLWQGSFRSLGEFDFCSRALSGNSKTAFLPEDTGNRFRGTLLSRVPVPLPADFLLGIDLQRRDFENGFSTWLLGRNRTGPVPEFYALAIVLKSPLPFLTLCVLACLSPPRTGWRDGLFLLAPAIALAVLVSSNATVNHVRYLLPALPFVCVWLGGVALSRPGRSWFRRSSRLLVAGSAFCGIFAMPWPLSYMNAMVRGPIQASSCLVDSQLDWGQGLFALRDWLDEHPEARPFRLAWWGSVNPRYAGIDFRLAPQQPAVVVPINSPDDLATPDCRGWVGVSATHLAGSAGTVFDSQGHRLPVQGSAFTWLRGRTPVAVVGGCVFIFDLTEPDQAESGLTECVPKTIPQVGAHRENQL